MGFGRGGLEVVAWGYYCARLGSVDVGMVYFEVESVVGFFSGMFVGLGGGGGGRCWGWWVCEAGGVTLSVGRGDGWCPGESWVRGGGGWFMDGGCLGGLGVMRCGLRWWGWGGVFSAWLWWFVVWCWYIMVLVVYRFFITIGLSFFCFFLSDLILFRMLLCVVWCLCISVGVFMYSLL